MGKFIPIGFYSAALLLLISDECCSQNLSVGDQYKLNNNWRDYYYYNKSYTQNPSNNSARQVTASGSSSNYPSKKAYSFSKKELEELQKESEQRAESGNLSEIYRCIDHYEYKGDVTRKRYWMEKACQYNDGYYCMELSKDLFYTKDQRFGWLNKASNAGIEQAFDEVVYYTFDNISPIRGIEMLESRALSKPYYYFTAALERFKLKTLAYDSLKGVELLKKGAAKGDSSCISWLRKLSNPQTASLAALGLGMKIREVSENGNWIIGEYFSDSYSLPDSLKNKIKPKADVIYTLDGVKLYESKGTLFSITNTLFVENQKAIINKKGEIVNKLEYDRIDPPVSGFIPVRKHSMQGYIDTLGNVIVAPEYPYVILLTNGTIIASDGRELVTRSANKKENTIPIVWKYQRNFDPHIPDTFVNSELPVFTLLVLNNSEEGVYIKKKRQPARFVVSPKANSFDWEPGQPIGVIDENGKWIVPLVPVPSSRYYLNYKKYFVFEKDGKQGAYSNTGELMLDAQFDYIYEYNFMSKDFIVFNDGKKGLYRSGGEKIVACEYSSIEYGVKVINGKSYTGCFYENGRVRGFINEKGKVLFEEQK